MRGFLMMIAATGLAGAGCVANDTQACNELSAVPGFELNVNEAPGLADAVYTWTVTADGVTRTRTVTLKNGYGTCDCAEAGLADPRGIADLAITMQDGGAQLTLTDDPNGPRRAGPPHIDVAIVRGQQQIATFTFDPLYRPVSDQCQSVDRAMYDVNVIGP
jgi:hypothetical protein